MKLEWRDIIFDTDWVAVRDPKNSEERYVPMHGQLRVALLEAVPEGTTTNDLKECNDHVFINPKTGRTYTDVRKPMTRALEKAGITRHIRFHDLRHTTGSHLAMQGCTEREIAEILGHKDPTVTRRYTHLTRDHIRSVVDRLDFSGNAPDSKLDNRLQVSQ